MKKSYKLVILFFVLCALAAGYAGVKKLSSRAQENTEVEAVTLDKSDISQISWSDTENKTSVSLQKGSNEEWSCVDNADFPLDEQYAYDALAAVSEVNAVRVVTDDADNLSEYGLDSPLYTVTAVMKNNSETKFSIGDFNELSSLYYMRVNDESRVYLIDTSLVDIAKYTFYDIVALDWLPEIDSFNTVSITKGGRQYYKVNWYDGGRDDCYTELYEYFIENANGLIPVDVDKASDILSAVTGLSWGECVDYNASDTALQKYGLSDNQAVKISVDYTTQNVVDSGETDDDKKTEASNGSLELLVGNKTADESSYYVRVNGSKIVCTMAVSSLDVLLTQKESELYALDVCMIESDKITQADITYNGTQYKYTSESGDAGNKYYLNGEEIDESVFDEFMSALISLKGVELLSADESISGAPVFKAFIVASDKEYSYSLYGYKNEKLILDFDGSRRLIVNAADLESLPFK